MRKYSLSQNYFLYWDQGELYLTNPIDVLAHYRRKINPQMVPLLFQFLLPCDIFSVEQQVPAVHKQEWMVFLNMLIQEKVLVDHPQITDMGQIVSNMVKVIREVSSDEQIRFARKTALGKRLLGKMMSLVRCDRVIRMLKGKGLEIGGNVPAVSSFLPSSRALVHMDYGTKKDGSLQQDATDLSGFSDKEFDFIISSHTLEHLSNPIKALLEWTRVVKNAGYIYIVLPNKEYMSDYYRPLTSLAHLQQDYKKNIPLRDMAHVNEEEIKAPWWSMEHYQPQEAPYAHMHTWNMDSFLKLLKTLDLCVVDHWESSPYHLHVLIRVGENAEASNKTRLPILLVPGFLLLLTKIIYQKGFQRLRRQNNKE